MANKKQYGLVLPKKNQLCAPKVSNVFGNDDDSDEEEGTDWVKKALKGENEKNKIKKQTQINMQKALKEDPTIFQYDEVYDEIERTKEEEKSVKKVEKKPKYIENLLKSADLRKKEQELRKDRLIQKEIEAEDALYPDKERYVTSSYKAELEEKKKFKEEQDNQDRLEAIGDVTKQKDMSGFYRHLFRQTVDKNEADLGIAPKAKTETVKNDSKVPLDIDKDDPIPSDSDSEESSKSNHDDTKDVTTSSSIAKLKKKRQYRKRAQEASESESESEPEKEKEGQAAKENLENADDKNTSETPSKKQKLSDEVEDEKADKRSSSPSADEVAKQKDNKSEENKDKIEEEKPKVEEKIKINIWEKRTVGPVFEAALQRYLIRKQERLAGS